MNKSQPPPKKHLGQHFLRDARVLSRVLQAADLKKTDAVLEIGPGLGILTKALAPRVKKVIAVEKDPRLVKILHETLANFKNVTVVNQDILQLSGFRFQVSGFKVIANLPYYITSPVIRKFLEAPKKPKLMVLMVQKEVAQRICAKPPHMSMLAVSVQFYAKPEIVSFVSKNSFWPVPKIDSAILRITPIPTDRNTHAHRFFRVVKLGFRHPRKQLVNNLPRGFRFPKGINPAQRAETLSLQDWISLAKNAIIEA